MPKENQNPPGKDLRGLWLLPILALGLGVFVTSLKKPAPRPADTADQTKHDIYNNSTYHLMGRVAFDQPKGFTFVGFAPYSGDSVKELGPNQFLCSSSLRVRSKTGETQEERWQCVMTKGDSSWTMDSFKLAAPKRVTSGVAQISATTARKQ